MNPTLMKYRRLFLQPWAVTTGTTVLRIWLGAMMIFHGSSKVFDGMTKITASLTERGWPLPWLQGFMASYVEFAGGILLVVGLFTRPVAAIAAGMFAVIGFIFHGADPFGKKELALGYLVMAVIVFLAGPGRLSVDQQIFNAAQNAEPERG